MPAITPTDVCNLALDEVPAARIQSVNEESVAGRVCALQYPQAVRELLEEHSWSFGRRTQALAQLSASDRPESWVYAYALPTDCALPIRVYQRGQSSPSYTGTVGQMPAALGGLAGAPDPYDIAGSTLYANVPDLMLEFISWSADGFSPAFVRAAAARLASYIVMPIRKDGRRQRELVELAEMRVKRAQQVDASKTPHSYGNFIPAALIARGGVMPAGALTPPQGAEQIPDSDYVAIFLSELGI